MKFVVSGLSELMFRMGALSDRAIKKNVRAALAAATKPMIADARSRVPVRYGFLRKAIGMVMRFYSGVTVAVLGARADAKGTLPGKWKFRHATGKAQSGGTRYAVPGFYAHLVERGTKPHALGEGSIRVRRSMRKGKPVELGAGPQRGRRHPGAQANPFLEPAFRSNQRAAVEIIAGVLGKALEAEGKKAA